MDSDVPPWRGIRRDRTPPLLTKLTWEILVGLVMVMIGQAR